MAEQIGLEAVLQDANFQAGLKRYLSGIGEMEKKTEGASVSISKGFVTLGDKVWSVSGTIAKAGGIAGAAVATAAAVVTKSALDIAGDYQASMNVLQATTGASETQMAQLGVLAKELGADMTLPATSAADAGVAMTEMAKAGLDVNNILGASRGVLQLSAAANISNAEAAMITVNALKAFNLAGTEANRVADLLTAAATSSGSSVSDMGMAFQMGAAVANQAGVSIGDFTTMLAEMSQAGIKGSDAGTSIKTMLLRLAAPTSAAADAMKNLGINIYDAHGKMLPITDIIGNMNTALYGTAEVMATVGGRTKEQDDRLKQLKQTNASLVKQYRDLESGVSGAAMTEDKRREKLAALAWEIGKSQEAMNALNGIQGKSIMTTRQLSEEERNAALYTIFGTDAIRAASIVVGKGTDAFDSMSDKVNKSGKAADMAGARMKGFKGMMAGLQSQAETALLAFAEPLLTPLEDFGREIADVFGRPETLAAIQQFGELVGMNVAEAITFVSDAFNTLVNTGWEGLAWWLGVSPETTATIKEVFGFLQANLPSIAGALAGISAVLGGAAIASAIAAIGAAIAAVGAPVLALIGAAALLGAAWNGNWFGIRDTVTAVWNNTILPTLTTLWNWLSVNVPAAIQTLSNFWNNTLMPALTAVWNFINMNIIPLLGALANVWIAAVSKYVEILAGLWQNVLYPALNTVWSFISTNVIPILSQLWNFISTTLLPVLDALGIITLPNISSAFNGIVNAIQSVIRFLGDLANEINSLQLPSWLRPGSPTPFEIGLLGVAGASDTVTTALGDMATIAAERLNPTLGPNGNGTIANLQTIQTIAAGANDSIANPLSAAFRAVGNAAALADNVVASVVSDLRDIKSMNGLVTTITIITHHIDTYTSKEGDNGGGGGGGGGRGRQHGGPIWSTGWWYLHGGEFILSRSMLRGLGGLLQSQTQMIQSLGRPQPGSNVNTINRTINNTLNVTTMSPSENIISDFGMMNAMAAI